MWLPCKCGTMSLAHERAPREMLRCTVRLDIILKLNRYRRLLAPERVVGLVNEELDRLRDARARFGVSAVTRTSVHALNCQCRWNSRWKSQCLQVGWLIRVCCITPRESRVSDILSQSSSTISKA